MDFSGYGYRKRATKPESANGGVSQSTGERSPELSATALRLLASLDRHVSLSVLPAQFPRVLNRIADVWNRPVMADQLFDDLLLDGRGGREGFPCSVIQELTRLRGYHLVAYPKKIDPWDQAHLR
jgi:hypothetical protein